MKRVRIDKLLLDRGMVASRERARALIMAGDVLVDETPIEKAGTAVDPASQIRLRRPPHTYASRGGLKLAGALEAFGVDPTGWVCADVGASTGGFTDCLLKAGARHVYAIDVDTTQLDWRLRSDSRVTLVEGNARYWSSDWIAEPVDLVTIDVSFISLDKILPVLGEVLTPAGAGLALVKPQFELGPEKVGKGGIVSDPALHEEAVSRITRLALRLGFRVEGSRPSSITGKAGNQEFFLYLRTT